MTARKPSCVGAGRGSWRLLGRMAAIDGADFLYYSDGVSVCRTRAGHAVEADGTPMGMRWESSLPHWERYQPAIAPEFVPA